MKLRTMVKITSVLNIVALIILLFPENIQRKFIPRLPFKKIEKAIAPVNPTSQFKLNNRYIEKRKLTFWHRADNVPYSKNSRKILFCRLIEPCHV